MTSTQRTGVLVLWLTTILAIPAAGAQPAAEARDMEQLSRLDLNGHGDGGEGDPGIQERSAVHAAVD